MKTDSIRRRHFIAGSAVAAGSVAGAATLDATKTRSYNENMEYRRLGKTNLMVSAVCLGGHWKRMTKMVPGLYEKRWLEADTDNPDFIQNRHDVISRCIDHGINYVDACTGPECIMYSRALKGRRDKMYLGWSWYRKESRRPEWRTTEKLLQGFEEGLLEAKQEYADLWRITCHSQGGRHSPREVEAIIEALAKAKKQGKARFTGISTHDHPWLMMMIETFPEQIEVICTPYTASSKVLPKDSLFDVLKKHDCGAFGIKPFASNSLFEGSGAPNDPHAEQDSRRARLAIRYIVGNPGITAPIPGMINVEQVDNVATAIQERRQAAHLDPKETAELAMAGERMWEKLPPNYQWLKNWEYV